MDRAFKDPSETEGEADAAAPGLLWRLGSTIATPITTVAYLPVRMMDYFFPNPVVQEYPLADHSALLFLVLTHQSPVEMLLEHEGDEDEGDTVFINPCVSCLRISLRSVLPRSPRARARGGKR